YRYKNEGFLKNRLDAVTYTQWTAPSPNSFKGYYLAANVRDEFESPFVKNDEFNIAVELLARVIHTHGKKLTESAQRASHWLALGSIKVKERLAILNQKTSQWLTSKHAVRWDARAIKLRNED